MAPDSPAPPPRPPRLAGGRLARLRTSIGEAIGVDEANVGVQVAVLRPWYFRLLHRESTWCLPWVDFLCNSRSRPACSLVLVGQAPGNGDLARLMPEHDHWRLGVGLPGEVLFGAKQWVSDSYASRIVAVPYDTWPVLLDQMSPRMFEDIPREVRHGRTRKEMIGLRDLYGAAVGAGLRLATARHPFGCLVGFVPRGVRLDEDQLGLFGSELGAAASMLAYDIVENLRYPPLFGETDWDKVKAALRIPPPPTPEPVT